MSENTSKIPEGATHEWTPAESGRWAFVTYHQLRYYKKVAEDWWVWSGVTGWRQSGNDLYWFENETEQGFFKELQHEHSRS